MAHSPLRISFLKRLNSCQSKIKSDLNYFLLVSCKLLLEKVTTILKRSRNIELFQDFPQKIQNLLQERTVLSKISYVSKIPGDKQPTTINATNISYQNYYHSTRTILTIYSSDIILTSVGDCIVRNRNSFSRRSYFSNFSGDIQMIKYVFKFTSAYTTPTCSELTCTALKV